MPRKNKAGRIPRIENIKEKVKGLREQGYSYTEIGEMLKMSRHLAWWHGRELSTKKGIAK